VPETVTEPIEPEALPIQKLALVPVLVTVPPLVMARYPVPVEPTYSEVTVHLAPVPSTYALPVMPAA